jgi:hypothetical protein
MILMTRIRHGPERSMYLDSTIWDTLTFVAIFLKENKLTSSWFLMVMEYAIRRAIFPREEI